MTRIPSIDGLRRIAAFFRSHPIVEVALCGLAATVAINPFRETPFQDDWAYARMVKAYLDTGAHQADAWVAANPILQIVWGALFSSVFGFSFSTLRLSTLALAVVGIASFYLLGRDHALGRREAAMLTLVLTASPVFLGLSFTFMTDVPFFSLLVLSMLLYGRALRSGRVAMCLAASMAGAATVLTRQFGAVLLPAVVLTAVIGATGGTRARILLSLLLPGLATFYQLWLGTADANWTAGRLVYDQREHLRSVAFIGEALWRPAAVLLYVTLFALPLAVPLTHRLRTIRVGYRVETLLGLLVAAGIIAGATWSWHPVLLPLMGWNLDVILQWPLAVRVVLTAFVLLTASFVGGCIVRRYLTVSRSSLTAPEWLLDVTTAVYLLSQLAFAQFGDEYLLPLLPYVLVVVGRDVWLARPQSSFAVLRVVTVLILLLSVLDHRALLSLTEAQWTGAEMATTLGARPEQVAASWEWDAYHGLFDRFIASGTGNSSSPSLRIAINDYVERWSPQHTDHARFLSVTLDGPPGVDSDFTVLATVPYRDGFLRQKVVYVISRRNAEDPGMNFGSIAAAAGVTGTLTPEANPAPACVKTGRAATTIIWTATGTDKIEIRVGAPNGPLFAEGEAKGIVKTDNWILPGTTFYLQNKADDAPLVPGHTLARLVMQTVPGGPCP